MTEVYLIRHGESEANVAEFLDISSDTYIFDAELTPKGKMQAKATANKLNHIEFDLIVSSPLSRATVQRRLAELNSLQVPMLPLRSGFDFNPCNACI